MKAKTPSKSPFLVLQEFISPLLCEQIVDSLDFVEPDTDPEDVPIVTLKQNAKFEAVLFQYFQKHLPEIEQHYGVQYRGMKSVDFKWYPADCKGDEKVICENATYSDKKRVWIKNRDRDLTCVLFLSDYNSKVPFESSYEVYGGKYEFPQHGFGFNAERGTLVIYPSGPHFLNTVAPVEFGDLFVAKFHIATQAPFFYNPQDFPGDFRTWFETIA